MVSGDLIREARLRAGLSQAELGAVLGKQATAISRWERGEVAPSLETLREIVRGCDLDLSLGLVNRDQDRHDAALIERGLRLSPAERLAEGVAQFRAIERMARNAAQSRHG